MGDAIEPTPSTSEQVASLESVIAESLGQNEETPLIAVKPPKKNKGGRKKGSVPWNHPSRMAQGGQIQAPEGVGGIAADPTPTVDPEQFKPHIEYLCTLLGNHFADKTGCEALRSDEDEVKMLAGPGAEVIAKYFPVAEGKASPEAALLMAVATVIGGKVLIYRMYLADQRKAQAPAAPEATGQASPAPVEAFEVLSSAP